MGSDSGTARSVSSRDRSSRLPGSACFWPFWISRHEQISSHLALQYQWKCVDVAVLHLSCHLCRSGSEAKASRSVLLLLDTFDPGAEMKLYVETFLRGEVLQKPVETLRISGTQPQLMLWCLD